MKTHSSLLLPHSSLLTARGPCYTESMTQARQRQAAKEFAAFWKDRGDEKQETSRFWIELLGDVLGIVSPARYIEFEKPVKLRHTGFIDAYISSTKVLIEQKGSKIDLAKPQEHSDGAALTPYQQAKRYADELPYDLRPRWIVVSNFAEIHVHDMNQPHAEPEVILLESLEKEFYRLQFLVDSRSQQIRREEEISLQAGILVGRLYDALIKEYIEPDEGSFRSLNILCVRLVFCFYAEDAGLFETRTSFEDYIKSFSLPSLRDAFIKLFKGLDTELENRDKYDTSLRAFPYVNGGLFAAEDIEIPSFTQEIVDVLVNHCAPFNWAEISPTIFGAVFESTLNPDTRRTGGMHYTSIENIHKVIDPLFLEELEAEFEEICSTKAAKAKSDKLHAFQERLGSLKFLDPACGSGNFLTETYLSLRRLENRVISILNKGEKVLGFDEFIKVKISQFHGIEINDFAVTVAKTALWIAESQMMAETERIVGVGLDFLPLSTGALIVEGNALRMDWETFEVLPEGANVMYADKTNIYKIDSGSPLILSEPPAKYGEVNIVTKEVVFKNIEDLQAPQAVSVEYDYIIGNPPFVGYGLQSPRQKEDTLLTYCDEDGKPYKTAGKIDYVSNWYFKAAQTIFGKKTRCAFVSTNSITQGEQVASVWKPIFQRFDIHFDFAYQTFRWTNETLDKKHMAAVHCVIIGFSSCEGGKDKVLFDSLGNGRVVREINGYLLEARNVFVESRPKPLCDVPYMTTGNRPADGGHFIIEADEYDEFIRKEPAALPFIKKLTGAEEFINNRNRYCLWLVGASPAELRKMPLVAKRVELCRQDRLNGAPDRQKLADTPTVFREIKNPERYIIVPRVSSENRRYIPIGFLDAQTIPTDSATIIIDATPYEFGILTSSIHMAWMRAVCGRLKSDYRYSKDIVYNNFPWPNPTDEQKAKIERTAQAILDARAKYPESSLADLYDETFMPLELRKAHQANDRAVMESYGFAKDTGESEIVAELFRMYEKLAEGR